MNQHLNFNLLIKFIIILLSLTLFSCDNASIDDISKRNPDWLFLENLENGVKSWIPISNNSGEKILNGKYTTFYFNGNIFETGKIDNGKIYDTVFCYDISGNIYSYKFLKADSLFVYFIKDGDYIGYRPDGKLLEKGIVKNHERGNMWIRYYENGAVEWIEKLNNRTGWTVWYFDNGQISDSTYHINGVGHGKSIHWYKNGNIQEICYWNLGKQDGLYELFYENGQIKQRANWTNGKRNGKSLGWSENGQLQFVHYYESGIRK